MLREYSFGGGKVYGVIIALLWFLYPQAYGALAAGLDTWRGEFLLGPHQASWMPLIPSTPLMDFQNQFNIVLGKELTQRSYSPYTPSLWPAEK